MIGSSLYLSGLKTKVTDSDVFNVHDVMLNRNIPRRIITAAPDNNAALWGELLFLPQWNMRINIQQQCKHKLSTLEDAAQFASCYDLTGRTGSFNIFNQTRRHKNDQLLVTCRSIIDFSSEKKLSPFTPMIIANKRNANIAMNGPVLHGNYVTTLQELSSSRPAQADECRKKSEANSELTLLRSKISWKISKKKWWVMFEWKNI